MVNMELTTFFFRVGRQSQDQSFVINMNAPRPKPMAQETVIVRSPSAGLPRGIAIMRAGSHAYKHGPSGRNTTNCNDSADQTPFGLEIHAPCQDVRKAVGLMLAIARVERQQVVRDGPYSTRIRVHPAWWVAPGDLVVIVNVPQGSVLSELGRAAGECPIAAFDRMNEQLFEGALADALGVAAALQRCIRIVLNKSRADTKELIAHSTQHCRCLSKRKDT